METLILLSNLLCIVFGTVVGVRLLRLARSTRQIPELSIGLALILFALVAKPATILAPFLLEQFGWSVRLVALALASGAHAGQIVTLFAFNWIVFRRTSIVAKVSIGLAAVISSLAAVGLVVSIASVSPDTPLTMGARLSTAVIAVGFTCAFGWSAIEALLYYRLMRRRLRIGLADPVVVNRFFVWGLTCSVTALVTFGLIVSAAIGLSFSTHPVPILLSVSGGVINSIGWTLTFLAPERYRDWIGTRAKRRASQAR